MFSQKIVGSDAFLEMPPTTRELYFQLGMYADDDGFVNPKKIVRMVSASEDDLKLLVLKRFVLPFESGVIVIKHWKMNNYIQADRYTPTQYLEEKKRLETKENLAYTECIQDVSKLDTQVRIGKDRIGKVSSGKDTKNMHAPKAHATPKEKTPKDEAQEFFNNFKAIMMDKTERNGLTDWLAELAGDDINKKKAIWSEIQKFVAYWTERNKSGTKERWETERTWEWKRRLYTWFNRAKVETAKQQPTEKKIII